jgi:hypothetical protein
MLTKGGFVLILKQILVFSGREMAGYTAPRAGGSLNS